MRAFVLHICLSHMCALILHHSLTHSHHISVHAQKTRRKRGCFMIFQTTADTQPNTDNDVAKHISAPPPAAKHISAPPLNTHVDMGMDRSKDTDADTETDFVAVTTNNTSNTTNTTNTNTNTTNTVCCGAGWWPVGHRSKRERPYAINCAHPLGWPK